MNQKVKHTNWLCRSLPVLQSLVQLTCADKRRWVLSLTSSEEPTPGEKAVASGLSHAGSFGNRMAVRRAGNQRDG